MASKKRVQQPEPVDWEDGQSENDVQDAIGDQDANNYRDAQADRSQRPSADAIIGAQTGDVALGNANGAVSLRRGQRQRKQVIAQRPTIDQDAQTARRSRQDQQARSVRNISKSSKGAQYPRPPPTSNARGAPVPSKSERSRRAQSPSPDDIEKEEEDQESTGAPGDDALPIGDDHGGSVTAAQMTTKIIKMTTSAFDAAEMFERYLKQRSPATPASAQKVRAALEKICGKYKRAAEDDEEEARPSSKRAKNSKKTVTKGKKQ
ncbi:hypothetical protein BKA63DRAFT_485542 [Paraphoma chrysanthemicola]|nr:hypothetical protein BKA63DRAFT_485542 [Paraphoma chrysanthemicola]